VTGAGLVAITAAPSTAAMAEPTSTPILATAARSLCGKAWSAISSATGSLTPQSRAAPKKARSGVSSGITAIRALTAAKAASVTPSGLPTTRPSTTPTSTRRASGEPRSRLSEAPVAEKANSGSTT
jgi:hypothetical protein